MLLGVSDILQAQLTTLWSSLSLETGQGTIPFNCLMQLQTKVVFDTSEVTLLIDPS